MSSLGKLLLKDDNFTGGSFIVYAVSLNGIVLSEQFDYTVAKETTNPSFLIKYSGEIIGNDSYILQKTNEVTTITVSLGTGDSLSNVVVTANGAGVGTTSTSNPNECSFTLPTTGTGIYEVVVTASVTQSGVTTTLLQHFLVYVVGDIVSADLDPSVISR